MAQTATDEIKRTSFILLPVISMLLICKQETTENFSLTLTVTEGRVAQGKLSLQVLNYLQKLLKSLCEANTVPMGMKKCNMNGYND